MPTPAKRNDVKWHVTPDGSGVVFDESVSIAAKRDECSVTADGRVVGDCYLTPDGNIAFINAVSIPAKRGGPRKPEIPNLDCYLQGSDPLPPSLAINSDNEPGAGYYRKGLDPSGVEAGHNHHF